VWHLRETSNKYRLRAARPATHVEIDYIWHQPQSVRPLGVPIDEERAPAGPAALVPVYENPQVKIFGVRLK
jgi:hypothetical protein